MNPKTLGRIAFAVFRESVRERVLYTLVGFALVVMGASYLIGQLTAGQDVKIIKDLGLSAMSIFGLFIAVFIGIGLVSKEVERRSIYSLLAKPIDVRAFPEQVRAYARNRASIPIDGRGGTVGTDARAPDPSSDP